MRKKSFIRSFLFATVIFVLSTYLYLPFYVTKPGMAKELGEIITVEDGYHETGNFMLTTVRMGRANIYSYTLAKIGQYNEILPIEKVRSKDETEEEYNVRQLHYMDTSKLAAIEVAYKKAGKSVAYRYDGIYVLSLIPNMPAEEQLKPGDRIFKVDNREFTTQQAFMDYINNKHEGETITVTFERKDKTKTATIPIVKFPNEEEKIGIGIVLVEDKTIVATPEVTMKTDEIGGPSAGLMFSLEIFNQLQEEDYTRGYQVAGTGTIDKNGSVGRIGGIDQKVVAAHKTGAEIFFAPYENGIENSNYDVAVKTANEIKTDMVIVPVDSFDDAIQYLQNLSPKS